MCFFFNRCENLWGGVSYLNSSIMRICDRSNAGRSINLVFGIYEHLLKFELMLKYEHLLIFEHMLKLEHMIKLYAPKFML